METKTYTVYKLTLHTLDSGLRVTGQVLPENVIL